MMNDMMTDINDEPVADGSVLVYRFFGRIPLYVYRGCISAITIDDSGLEKLTARKVFNNMGFRNINQYIECYPGNFKKDSIFTENLYDNDDSKFYLNDDPIRRNVNIFGVAYTKPSSIGIIYTALKEMRRCEIISTVTISELMKSALYSKDGEPYPGIETWGCDVRYVWFCSDWKDPDDSIDEETLTEMDHSIDNMKKGIVSPEIDLSDFNEE